MAREHRMDTLTGTVSYRLTVLRSRLRPTEDMILQKLRIRSTSSEEDHQ